jgi:V8-like Glu-specific endopeptidase
VKWRAAVLGFTLFLGLVPTNNAQAVYNGTSALGSPYVVLVSTPGTLCSGSLIEPQILVTAAHCVVNNGEVVSASDIGVYEPGVDRNQSSFAARGYEVFYLSDYYNDTLAIEPNDIAFVVLNNAIKSSIRLKLADYETTQLLINQGVSLMSYGYGRTDLNTSTTSPRKVAARPMQQKRFSGFQGYERTYINYAADEYGSLCPGDSGGPTIAEYKGQSYLVSVHSGSRGPCSRSSEGTWGSTGTIAGEYEYLYDEAKSFLDELKPTDASNLRVTSFGLSANITWDLVRNSPVPTTGYVVKDSDSNELCRTTINSCQVNLKPGLNELTVFTMAGSILSDGVTIEYVIENATNPELIGIDTYQSQAAVKWTPIRDFGGANPDRTYIEIRDASDGSVLCTAPSSQNECRFSFTQRSYNLLLNINSDLGQTERTQLGRFSGILQASMVSRTLNISQSINTQLKSYLITNPGYALEIEQVQSQVPILTLEFIYTEDVLNQLLDARNNVSVLVSRIIANPRKITITCIKGKLTKKVTGANPMCPTGYKVKK